MWIEIPWYGQVFLIALMFWFLYALIKHHGRVLDEQMNREKNERKL
jgi:hypothetical protein